MFKNLKNKLEVVSKKIGEATGSTTSNENPDYLAKIDNFRVTRKNFQALQSMAQKVFRTAPVIEGTTIETALPFHYQHIEPTEVIRSQYQDQRQNFEVLAVRLAKLKAAAVPNPTEIAETQASHDIMQSQFMATREQLGTAMDNIEIHKNKAHQDSLQAIAKVMMQVIPEWNKPKPEKMADGPAVSL